MFSQCCHCRKNSPRQKTKNRSFLRPTLFPLWPAAEPRNGAQATRRAPWTRSLPVSPSPHHPPHSRSSDNVCELVSPRPAPRRRRRVGPAPPAVFRATRARCGGRRRRRTPEKCSASPADEAGQNRWPRPPTRRSPRPGASRRTRLVTRFARRAHESPLAKAGESVPPPALLVDLRGSTRWLSRGSKEQRHNVPCAASASPDVWRCTGEQKTCLFYKLIALTSPFSNFLRL